MLRLTRTATHRSTLRNIYRCGAVCREIHSSAGNANQESASSAPPPPPPRKRKGGIFWKLLGITLVSGGGVIGYAWYDPEFRKTIEDNVPYSTEAFSYVFEYLPDSVPDLPSLPSFPSLPSIPSLSDLTSIFEGKPKEIGTVTKQEPAAVPPKEPVPVPITPVKPAETEKERVAREAREKKEKAQELIRKREAEEAAQNLALETGLETLLASVQKSIEAAVDAQHAAAKAVSAHTELLKKAMEAESREDDWRTLTELQQARTDAVWASEKTVQHAEELLDKLERAIANGREDKSTKRNKMLSKAEKEQTKFSRDLSAAAAELMKAKAQSTVLTSYRDLVRKGQDHFSKELEDMVPGVQLGEKTGHLTTTELNSLIGHAHRRVEQLQRQLVEQSAMEPLIVGAALDGRRAEDERRIDEQVAEERQRFAAEVDKLRAAWETGARAEFEAELRQQLARQAAVHSDHLTSKLRAQRIQLEAAFEKLLVAGLQAEKEKLADEIGPLVSRVKAIESAVDGRAERQRSGQFARELWIACRTLLSAINLGQPGTDGPTPVRAELSAVRDAGSEYPIVHVALSTVSTEAFNRGVYTPEALKQRFDRVRRVARRVAMVDESGGTMARYILSYVQSAFVFRSATVSDGDDASSLSVFSLLDNAAHCLQRGDIEQAVRYVNQLTGEPRRVALDWLNEARLLLETRQAAELLLAFASANGLGSLD